MSTFEFAARMWRGAGAMVQMQEELFGQQIGKRPACLTLMAL
jgi:hypothetical protein